MSESLGVRDLLRWAWLSLTSMRTALGLLFLLSLAAIPGSMVPQRPVTPMKVDDFKADNPMLGTIYEALGVFDVYSSVWFSAIYLLLFVSLIGCIVPRIGVYVRALRGQPPRAPRILTRLPAHAVARAGSSSLDDIAAELRRRHFRVVRHEGSVAAEKGYLREFGNLLFHLSLVLVLIGVAISSLGGFRGTAIVVVGQGFSNTLTQYDEIQAGSSFSEDRLVPFSMTVDSFVARFEDGPVQTGAAREFRADVTVTAHPGDTPRQDTIEVNHPLNFDGTVVHLSGHGYAPVVEVRDAHGDIAYSGPVVFVPQDGNFTSVGVIKAPDARPDRLAFEGFFLPTGVIDERGPHSTFPDTLDPMLIINGWSGPPKKETGEPENVYVLDTTGLEQMTENGDPWRVIMRPGETVDLPDGLGTLTYRGQERWVKLQISETPGVTVSLIGVGLAILGLMLSLFIVPRRVWARVEDDGRLVVAGLDRAEARSGLEDEVSTIATLGHHEHTEGES